MYQEFPLPNQENSTNEEPAVALLRELCHRSDISSKRTIQIVVSLLDSAIPIRVRRRARTDSHTSPGHRDPDEGFVSGERSSELFVAWDIQIGKDDFTISQRSTIFGTDTEALLRKLNGSPLGSFDIQYRPLVHASSELNSETSMNALDGDAREKFLRDYYRVASLAAEQSTPDIRAHLDEIIATDPEHRAALVDRIRQRALSDDSLREIGVEIQYYGEDVPGKIHAVQDSLTSLHYTEIGKCMGLDVKYSKNTKAQRLSINNVTGQVKAELGIPEILERLSQYEVQRKQPSLSYQYLYAQAQEILMRYRDIQEKVRSSVEKAQETLFTYAGDTRWDVVALIDKDGSEKMHISNDNEAILGPFNLDTDAVVDVYTYFKTDKNARGVIDVKIQLPDGELTEAQILEIEKLIYKTLFGENRSEEQDDHIARLYGFADALEVRGKITLLIEELRKKNSEDQHAVFEWSYAKKIDPANPNLEESPGEWIQNESDSLLRPIEIDPDVLAFVSAEPKGSAVPPSSTVVQELAEPIEVNSKPTTSEVAPVEKNPAMKVYLLEKLIDADVSALVALVHDTRLKASDVGKWRLAVAALAAKDVTGVLALSSAHIESESTMDEVMGTLKKAQSELSHYASAQTIKEQQLLERALTAVETYMKLIRAKNSPDVQGLFKEDAESLQKFILLMYPKVSDTSKTMEEHISSTLEEMTS